MNTLFNVLVFSIGLLPALALAQTQPSPSPAPAPVSIALTPRLVIGPEIQWGEKSQTFNLVIGGLRNLEVTADEKPMTDWQGMTLKLGATRHENETAAYGAVLSMVGGGRKANGIGGNFELGFGVLGKDGQNISVTQLGFALGRPGSLQAGVLTQTPLYTSQKPVWFTDLQFYLRWTFNAFTGNTVTFVQK
ncbi:MAG TPA: hypothetical protein VFV50_11205, partial [Bdellovibrionales bacterium]|nr:hypothetical protein [Bdellovibrionales bacterium]